MLAIGIDIGGTKIACALVDSDGATHAEIRLPTDAHAGLHAVLARIEDAIESLLKQSEGRTIHGIGIGCPGYVDPVHGVIMKAVNLGWDNVPLADLLRQRIGTRYPIYIANDVGALAQGEKVFGAARGSTDFVLIALGTGLGAAAVVNGQPMTGSRFGGMELGHTALVKEGRLCACGLHGCLEMYVSGLGVMAAVREYLPRFPDSTLHSIDPITPADVITAARAGDALGEYIVCETGDYLTQAILACTGTLNPERVVIGGGLGLALFDLLIEPVTANVKSRAHPVAQPKIVRSEVQSSAVGAAALVWSRRMAAG